MLDFQVSRLCRSLPYPLLRHAVPGGDSPVLFGAQSGTGPKAGTGQTVAESNTSVGRDRDSHDCGLHIHLLIL